VLDGIPIRALDRGVVRHPLFPNDLPRNPRTLKCKVMPQFRLRSAMRGPRRDGAGGWAVFPVQFPVDPPFSAAVGVHGRRANTVQPAFGEPRVLTVPLNRRSVSAVAETINKPGTQ